MIKLIIIWLVLGLAGCCAFCTIAARLKSPEERALEDLEQEEFIRQYNEKKKVEGCPRG